MQRKRSKSRNQVEGFVMAISNSARIEQRTCIEKNVIEAGLDSVEDYCKAYTGVNVARSETRLYGLYESLADVLTLAGMTNVLAQGVEGTVKADLTVATVGNTYGPFKSYLQVSPDLTFNKPADTDGIIRAIEVRAGSKNLGKNIHNNVRSLAGEIDHFNHIVGTKCGIKGNYLTIVNFVDIESADFGNVMSSMLGLYETGKRVAVIPFKNTTNGAVVYLDAVPEPLQLMRVLRDI